MSISTFAALADWPFCAAGSLLYLSVVTGVPNVENLPGRARFAQARRRSPWLTGIAMSFIAAGLVCSTIYFVNFATRLFLSGRSGGGKRVARRADQLLPGGRSLVQDVRPGPVALGQPRVQEHAQVIADGAKRKAGDGG